MRKSIVEKKLVTDEQKQRIRDALKLIEKDLPNFFSGLKVEKNRKKNVKKQFEKCIRTIKIDLESKELTVDQLYKVKPLIDWHRKLLKNVLKPEGTDIDAVDDLCKKLDIFSILIDECCASVALLRSPLLVSEIKIESYARRFIKFVMAILESIKNFLCGIIYYKNSSSVGSEEKCSGLQADITPVQTMQRDYYGPQQDTSQHNRPVSR